MSMRIKKNDTVMVVKGRDAEHKKRGRVLEVLTDRQRLIVEGVNLVKRHVKAGRDAKAPRGGIVEAPASIHVSNVRLVCNRCNQPTRIGVRRLEDGKKVRFCKKCNENIDK
jgi:large subunit ribosomal protein L24